MLLDALAIPTHVTALCGDALVAVEARAVREVVREARVQAVAGARPPVDGVVSIRGRIVPVLSLAALLGVPDQRRADETRGTSDLVVLAEGERCVAVAVPRVVGLATLVDSDIAPAAPDAVGEASGHVAGVAAMGDRSVYILAPERFFTPQR